MGYHRFICLFLGVISFCNINARDIESGKVYRFTNVNKPDQSMSVSKTGIGAITSVSDNNDIRQYWYVVANNESTGYYIRNVLNGSYLTSPRAFYTQWPMSFTSDPSEENMLMTITPLENSWIIKAASQGEGYNYAHSDAANNIVCWTSESLSSRWSIDKIEMSEEELDAILERFKNTNDEIAKSSEYENNLNCLFNDNACTVLKEDLDFSDNEHYLSLPSTLRKMVDKIREDDWSEISGDWADNYARKYRVQLYEPYSEGNSAAGLAGIQPYTNMNNPTGIIADEGDILYIMVNDEIPEGATVYIGGVPDNNMYNDVTGGIKLKKGLNMVLCGSDNTHYFIYYTVKTVENKKPVRRLADFSPIKIHIEGGKINGFFNYIGDDLYKPDTREDFLYTTERATHPMYDLIGKYVILHFFLEDTPDLPEDQNKYFGVKSCFNPEINTGSKRQYDPVVTMKAWDDMCFTERIVMGIQNDEDIANPYNRGYYSSIVGDKYEVGGYNADPGFYYSDFFNNRMMGITMQAKGLYMNATSWRTAYAPNTMVAILSMFPHEGIWGPAHEYGHINQTPMRIAGTTEESNNLFSNVANYFLCGTTSRCDYPVDQLKIFNENKTYLENGTWGTTRMFWQLWCYYHAAKNNTKFYPRLYELLRKYPLKRDTETIPGKLNPRYDLLHFAKMCCVAAGEDLTDFFTSWGFFVPQDNYHIDDYDVYDCILTQEDIDEVKKEIAELGLPENKAIILIDDRVESDLPTGFGYDKNRCGEFGGLKAFIEKKGINGNFEVFKEGEELIISGGGNPGGGFLVYDKAGNLLSFSNSSTFPLSQTAQLAFDEDNALVYAIGCDGSIMQIGATSVMEEIPFENTKPFDIYDINGRLIMKGANSDKLNGVSSGIYILKQEKSSRKIILNR